MAKRGRTRRRTVGIAILLVVGAILAAYLAGFFGIPSVAAVDNRFVGVNDSTTLIGTNLTVANPNPIGVSLGGVTVNYTVHLNEIRMAEGTKEGIALETGNSTLPFRTAMTNDRIPRWWTSHLLGGEESTLRVDAQVHSATLGRRSEFSPVDRPIQTDILSAFNSTETRPVEATVPLVSDPVLYINETGATWGDVSRARTPIPMALTVYNPKEVPYVVTEIGYTITMNGITVGTGASDRSTTIPPRTPTTIETVTVIDNDQLDAWWVSHLERNQETALRIEFYAKIDLPTGTVRVPLDALTYTETIETDIFGTKPAAGDGATPTPAGTGAAGTTAPPGTETATGTASPTVRPTPTPTSTPAPTTADESPGTPTEPPTGTDGDGGLLPGGNETDTDILG